MSCPFKNPEGAVFTTVPRVRLSYCKWNLPVLSGCQSLGLRDPTLDEDLLPWGDSRSTPRSMSALERNPQVLAPTDTRS